MENNFVRVSFSKRYSIAPYQTEEVSQEVYLDVTGKSLGEQLRMQAKAEAELELAVLIKLVHQGFVSEQDYKTRREQLIRTIEHIKKLYPLPTDDVAITEVKTDKNTVQNNN